MTPLSSGINNLWSTYIHTPFPLIDSAHSVVWAEWKLSIAQIASDIADASTLFLLAKISAMVSGIKAPDFQVAKRIAKIASDIADANDIVDASTLFLFAKIEKIEADIKALLANL